MIENIIVIYFSVIIYPFIFQYINMRHGIPAKDEGGGPK